MTKSLEEIVKKDLLCSVVWWLGLFLVSLVILLEKVGYEEEREEEKEL